jgi:hypothetical protein
MKMLTPKKYGKLTKSKYFKLVLGTDPICSQEWYRTRIRADTMAKSENNDKYEIFLMFQNRQNGIMIHRATPIGM